MTDNLQQAIAAIKSGDKAGGKKLLGQLLKADRKNEHAWLWMTRAVDSPTEQIQCLQNVLKINPKNEHAKQGLARMQPPAPPVELPPQPPSQDLPTLLAVQPVVSRPILPLPDFLQEDASPAELQPRPKPKVRALSSTSNQLSAQPATRQCPYCAETIKIEAKVCRFCGRDLTTGQSLSPVPVVQQVQPQIIVQAPLQREWSPGVAAVLSFILPGMGQLYKGQVGRGLVVFFMTAIGYGLIIPGFIMHLIAIIDAAQGNPYGNSGQLGAPGISKNSGSSDSSVILLVVIILAVLGLCVVCGIMGGSGPS